MNKVVEKKLLRLREELTEQLTANEPDIEVLITKAEGYTDLLPSYSEELHRHLTEQQVGELLKKELLFVRHVTSSLDDLKKARKDTLLAVVKGRKATSKY
ncbi:hypothetical protein [Idiomarina loihiensis]|uniref:hypothetical protein n=1 Tax=Idiomarina loihiensis TaxID=135577 RepID=UPI00384CEAF2